MTENRIVRIYADRIDDAKIDELNKLLENGEWFVRDVILHEDSADYLLEKNKICECGCH